MKKIAYILTLIFIPLTVFGQEEYCAKLSVSGSVSELGISPSEEIWIATKSGSVYYTKQIGDLWHVGSLNSANPDYDNLGKTFERLNFFSEDTLMISGFIHENNTQDIVYWSGNHGKDWEKIKFGKSSWIDAAYINNNGKAWMSGSSQLIYYTDSYGKTWKTFKKAGKENALRFSTIYFAKDEETGLFGSFWNVLYKTTNNCQSWKRIPTPLSQEKYLRISKSSRPEIKKIRMFGDFYIINQQGRVFITQSDSINWIYQPDIIDFEVTEKENLFTINQNLSISLYNTAFVNTWNSDKILDNYPKAIAVRNENLFTFTYDNIYKINRDEFTVSQLLTDEIPIEEPYEKLNFEGEQYGFEKKDILRYNRKRKQWYRFKTVDFYIANAALFENKIILSDRSLSKHYTFDPEDKTVELFNLPKELFDNLEVKKFHFENGSQGCFHHNNSLRTYIRKIDNFVVDKKASAQEYLSKARGEINADKIEHLLEIIDNSRFQKVSLNDLNITESDIKNFKKFIDKEESRIKRSGIEHSDFFKPYSFPGENTDFNFYKSVADSLASLSEEDINNSFLQTTQYYSTTREWRRVIFEFQKGKKLVIENSDNTPNYLYTPWVVNFEGLRFSSNSILFGQIIDDLTNGHFFGETARDKNYAIFKIADYLYRKKLDEIAFKQ